MSAAAVPAGPPDAASRSRLRRLGLGARLFAATGLVVLAGATTLLVVALLVAPPVFHTHLRIALGDLTPTTLAHADQAFATATLLSLAMAVAVAVLAALTVTWLVTRRIATPVADLAAAAGRLAGGQYDTRVPDPGLGPEFAALADSFNTMAARLASTERVRQRLLADLAHELRTPIASIQATVEAVADGVLAADETTLATLAEQTGRLDRLVADLTAVSRADERALDLDPRPHPLADLAAAAAAGLQARYAAKGITLTVTTTPGTPVVRVDADRLAEALGNLLDNALRHTPPGGTVTVTTDHTGQFGEEAARLTVTDTGDGFDPEDADRLFERLYRTDTARRRTTGGSGIGLTIAKAIITAHHGTITAHSAGPGHGATFTITLPATGGHRRP
jgi:two-component system, OmpR family, sensor histidine kinase BaeS